MRKRLSVVLLFFIASMIASMMFISLRFAAANPGGDLIIDNLILNPSDPVDGESVVVYVTVKNQGNETVTTDFYVSMWIDGQYKTQWIVREDLSPGESTSFGEMTATWATSPGDHDFEAEADSSNVVAEDDELNNEKTVEIYIEYPDLIVEDLLIEPSHGNDGETVKFRALIKNIGLEETKRDFRVYFYVDDVYLRYQVVTQNLASNETTAYATSPTASWTLTPGGHESEARVDQNNVVSESNETNNDLIKNFEVGYSDLIIEEITWYPQYPNDGETMTFYGTAKNIGLNETTRDFRVYFYIDDIQLSYKGVSANLAPGENATVTATWTCTPGNHEVKVYADKNNVVSESNETNNKLEKAFKVSQCDYIISDIQWDPTTPTPGETVTLYATVKNVGPGISIRDFRVYFYIDDVYFTYRMVSVNLALGETATVTANWVCTPGDHKIKAYADGTNLVLESEEKNNARSARARYYP